MSVFLLIRHAQTDWVDRVIAGRLPDIHLNEQGRDQAGHLAERLAPVPLAAIYTSPLERAAETAQPIAAGHKLELHYSKALTEIDIGLWTGKSLEELERRIAAGSILIRSAAARPPPAAKRCWKCSSVRSIGCAIGTRSTPTGLSLWSRMAT